MPIPDGATLRKWAEEGRFNPSDLIYHPDLQRWLYAQDVMEIRDALQKGANAKARDPHGASPAPKLRHTEGASTDFIIRQAGQDFRAPDVATLRDWTREGRIVRDAYVFHPVLNRWAYARDLAELEDLFKNSQASISNLAVSYRQLVLWVGVQISLSIGLLLFGSLAIIITPAIVVTVVALAFYAFRTAEALGSSSALLWAVAMLIPCINIITLLVLSSKATDVCRSNGVPVGFLGPRV